MIIQQTRFDVRKQASIFIRVIGDIIVYRSLKLRKGAKNRIVQFQPSVHIAWTDHRPVDQRPHRISSSFPYFLIDLWSRSSVHEIRQCRLVFFGRLIAYYSLAWPCFSSFGIKWYLATSFIGRQSEVLFLVSIGPTALTLSSPSDDRQTKTMSPSRDMYCLSNQSESVANMFRTSRCVSSRCSMRVVHI